MLTILLTSTIFAQAPENSERTILIPKETRIDFIGAEIKGNSVKPEMRLVQERAPASVGSLILLRTSFQTEMNHSVNDIK
jgi:hypothetical protein